MAASRGRRLSTTWSAVSLRCARGLRLTKKKPELEALAPPRPPAELMKTSMFGSERRTSLTAFWCRTRASNEIPSIASTWPEIWPMSCEGMKPLGMSQKHATVSSMIRNVPANIVRP